MSDSQRRIKRKNLVVIVLIIALVIVGCFFAATKYNLFSKQIFSFNSEEVELIRLRSGTTGQSLEYKDPADIQELTGFLNSFLYKSRFHDTPEERDGWSYGINLYIDEEEFSFQFDENRIFVEGYWYIRDNYFSELTVLIDS